MIAIINYGVGNICSIKNALSRIGAEYIYTSIAEEILAADRVILPGVGDASFAMRELRLSGLDRTVCSIKNPVLGICVGMQIMCKESEEGDTIGLNIFDTKVKKFRYNSSFKVPNMGWCKISNFSSMLFEDIADNEYVYYVHSYYPELCGSTIAISSHGADFSAALAKDNFYGTQFHPEKSGETGEIILKNFLKL